MIKSKEDNYLEAVAELAGVLVAVVVECSAVPFLYPLPPLPHVHTRLGVQGTHT